VWREKLKSNGYFWGDQRLSQNNRYITGLHVFPGMEKENIPLLHPHVIRSGNLDYLSTINQSIDNLSQILPKRMVHPNDAPLFIALHKDNKAKRIPHASVFNELRILNFNPLYLLPSKNPIHELYKEAIRIHELLHIVFSDTIIARSISGENRLRSIIENGVCSINEELYIEYLKEVQNLQSLYLKWPERNHQDYKAYTFSILASELKIKEIILKIYAKPNEAERKRIYDSVQFQEVYSDFGAAVFLSDPQVITKAIAVSPKDPDYYIRDFAFSNFSNLIKNFPGLQKKIETDPHVALLEIRYLLWKYFYSDINLEPGINRNYDKWVMGEVYETLEYIFENWSYIQQSQANHSQNKAVALYTKLIMVRALLAPALYHSKVEAQKLFNVELKHYNPFENDEYIIQDMAKLGVNSREQQTKALNTASYLTPFKFKKYATSTQDLD
jgi:hypothetical protein